MNESIGWSASLGRWLGIPVRIHALLLLCLVTLFGLNFFPDARTGGAESNEWTALVVGLVLLASVLWHEMAHAYAISNLGGHVNSLLFTPWGGNSDFALPTAGISRLLVHLAGPFANLAIFLIGAILLVQAGEASFVDLINPLAEVGLNLGHWEVSVLTIVTWVNFQLLWINLIPCFPFDGAAILRSTIDVLHPDTSRVHAEGSIRVIGQACGLTAVGAAWFLRDHEGGAIDPAWCWTLLFGIGLIFAARYSFLSETALFDEPWDDFNELEEGSLYEDSGFFDYEDDSATEYSQWLSEKQESRQQEELRIESEELERSDRILAKLHRSGLESLLEEERALLKRVSERLRRQREQNA